jgi:hypothetical protein
MQCNTKSIKIAKRKTLISKSRKGNAIPVLDMNYEKKVY